MRHRSESFACNVVFMIFGLRRFRPLPCGFMRFHYKNSTVKTIHCFGILLECNFRPRSHLRDAIWSFFTRHGWCHKSLQFSPRVFFLFKNFFVLFVILIGKVNSPGSSSIVELRFFFCPFLFFSILSGFTNFRPNFRPYMIWSGCRLNLCQSRPGPHISLWRFLFQ